MERLARLRLGLFRNIDNAIGASLVALSGREGERRGRVAARGTPLGEQLRRGLRAVGASWHGASMPSIFGSRGPGSLPSQPREFRHAPLPPDDASLRFVVCTLSDI